MVVILIVVGAFQYMRTTEMSEHYSLKQIEEFQMEEAGDGTLEIEVPQKHLLLYKDTEREGGVYKNLTEAFKFSKVDYDERSILEELKGVEEYASIIVMCSSYRGMSRDNFDLLKEYLEEGGNLIFLSTIPLSPFNLLMGVAGSRNYIETEGIVFQEKFFPGLEDINPSAEMMPGASLDVDLLTDVKVVAADNYATPIIWEREVGRGRIVSANTTLFEGKIARGVLSQLIAYGNDYFIMPIFNSKVVHLDDFPAPLPNGRDEELYREYRMKTRSFFKNIWWKDMEGIGKRQNIRYTGFLIGQYSDEVKKGNLDKFFQVHREDQGYLGRKLFQNGGELGVHGYNHLSLALDGGIDFEKHGYKSWESEENMLSAFKKLRELVDDLYGEDVRIYSYVPPTNLLTREGKAALIKSFPDLRSLSGLYTAGDERGVLLQEVERDPDYPELYSLPRFSWGLFPSNDVMWSIYNGIATYGMVSHFIHPDDILYMDRGGGFSWEELKGNYESIFDDINTRFPLLEPQLQMEVTKRYMGMEDVEMDYGRFGERIRINFKGFKGTINTLVRVRRERIKDVKGGDFYLIDSTHDYSLYLIKFHRKEGEILLGGA